MPKRAAKMSAPKKKGGGINADSAGFALPQYSKNHVQRCARRILDESIPEHEKGDAYAALNNFRAAHLYPMQSMTRDFRGEAKAHDSNAIVVQRLKRLPSIIAKLRRGKYTQITTMGDIGGARIIARDIATVQNIRRAIEGGETEHTLIACKDYIEQPKPSGYRGIHLVYSYQGGRKEYANYRVELQIRSGIQHAWATAVEVAGTFNDENLKAGQGDEEWLKFFQLASGAFQEMEDGRRAAPDSKAALQSAIAKLRVYETLSAYSVMAKQSSETEGVYLLTLDAAAKRVKMQHYPNDFLDDAMEDYRRREAEIRDSITQDVVLVSVDSIAALKRAYPNYFADTEVFLQKLKKAAE